MASPRECAPVAHAVTAAWFGPYVQKQHQIMQGILLLQENKPTGSLTRWGHLVGTMEIKIHKIHGL